MPYQANIPQPNNRIKDSQSDILQNFQAIDTVFAEDHEPFNSANEGKHASVRLTAQSPAPTFGATEVGIYNATYNNNTSVRNEVFVHKKTNNSSLNIPMTASILSQNGTVGTNTPGWTYLPSGILIHWGQWAGQGLVSVPLNSGFPAFAQIFTVQVTPFDSFGGIDSNYAVRVDSILSNSFDVYVSSRTSTGPASQPGGFQYLVIGRGA